MAIGDRALRVKDIPIVGDMAEKLSMRSLIMLVALDLIAFTNGDFILAWNLPLGILAFFMVIFIEGYVTNVTGTQRKTSGFFELVITRVTKEPYILLLAIVGGFLVAWNGHFLTLAFGGVIGAAKLAEAIEGN